MPPVLTTRRGSWLPVLSLLLVMACSPDAGMVGPSAPSLARGKPAPPPPPPPTAGVCNYDQGEDLSNWTRVFQDEFGGALSYGTDLEAPEGTWWAWTSGAFNEELQLYQPGNMSITGTGILAIEARKQTVTGPTHPWDPTPKQFEYTSGRIESWEHFSASTATPKVRLSARVKLASGYGMWPAFWSYGDPWPTQGEIDILEARGHEDLQYQTAYWWGRRAGVNQTRGTAKTIQTAASLMNCFHVYEVIWEKDRLTFFHDGVIVDTKTGGNIPNFFGKQQRVVLNLAVGGLFFSNLDPSQIQTGTMQVDWVRVYTQ